LPFFLGCVCVCMEMMGSSRETTIACVISAFCREVAENCALLRYYTVSRGNFLPTFWDTHPQGSRILRDSRQPCQ